MCPTGGWQQLDVVTGDTVLELPQRNNSLRWDEIDSSDFIEYGDYFVPQRQLQVEIVCAMIPAADRAVHVLDLCCGAGLLSHALLERLPNAIVHGYDGSLTMLKTARQRLAAFGDRFVTHQFDLADLSWRQLPWPVHAVVSSLATHHLDTEEKQALFRDVHTMLADDGMLVIADILQPVGKAATDLAGQQWDAVTRQQSLERLGSLSAYDRFIELEWNSFTNPHPDPVDKMSPLFDQLTWLEQAGFADVDVCWMLAGHAIFGGRKAGALPRAVAGGGLTA